MRKKQTKTSAQEMWIYLTRLHSLAADHQVDLRLGNRPRGVSMAGDRPAGTQGHGDASIRRKTAEPVV